MSHADLYLSDTQIVRRLRMSAMEWTAATKVLERHGLPKRDALFQDRRCWPAVEAFLIERARRFRALDNHEGEYHGFQRKP